VTVFWTIGSVASLFGLVVALVDLFYLRREEREIRGIEKRMEEQ